MKRIYLTGAALILFMILGVQYYNKVRPTSNTGNTALAQTVVPIKTTRTTHAVDNAPAEPVVITRPALAAAAPQCGKKAKAYTSRHRKNNAVHKHTYARKQKTIWYPPATIDHTRQMPATTAAPVTSQATAEIKFEAVKSYTGNIPRVNEVTAITIRRPHHNRPTGSVKIGLEAGAAESGFYDNHTSNVLTTSFLGGINVNIGMGKHVAVQPGLRYMGKGNETASTMDVKTQDRLKLHYLQMPVNIVYKFGDVENARIMVGAGPYVSYLLSAEQKYRTSNTTIGSFSDVIGSDESNGRTYNTSEVPSVDYGVGAFIGVETPEGIYAKVGGDLGLKHLQRQADGSHSDRNFSVMFAVGYMIGGYKK